MFERLKLSQLVLIIVVLPMVMQLVFVVRIAALMQEAETEARREAHARAVIMRLSEILHMATATAGGMAAYSVVGKNQFSTSSAPLDDCLRAEFPMLRELLKDDPEMKVALARLEKSAYSVERHLARIDQTISSGSTYGLLTDFKIIQPEIQKMTVDAGAIVDRQKVTEQLAPKIQEEKRAQLRATLIGFAIMNVLLAIGLAVFFNRRTTRRLNVVIDNGLRLGIGKELNAQLSGKDEIAKLDQVFHSAAEALAEAAGKERAVIENARDVICSVDASEKFTQVNAASYAIWGYESEQLIGKHVSEIIYQDDLESTRQALKRLMNGEEVPAIENRVRRRDGSLIDVNWSLRWSQKERSIFCVAHDITERRELERLKQEFVAMVSHDLRTPLTSIRGSLTLIGEGVFGETSPEAKQRIEIAQKNVNRLINLINDLLDI
ncbi:MAG TPA: PAS domain S-box protein, partial [Chroococcales cyanobacterium]